MGFFLSVEPFMTWVLCNEVICCEPILVYCASLGSGNWCDHWKQSVWFTPSSVLPVFKDEEVQLHAVHTETSISYEFKNSLDKKEVANLDLHTQDCQIVMSPERNALYGDSGWRYLMLNAIKKAVRLFHFLMEYNLLDLILPPVWPLNANNMA